MRAAIGYALGEDTIGLDRLRNKYAPKMAEGPDRRAFEVVTAPFNTNAPEFGDIARVVAAADTLEAFLRDIRASFPEPPDRSRVSRRAAGGAACRRAAQRRAAAAPAEARERFFVGSTGTAVLARANVTAPFSPGVTSCASSTSAR